MIWVHLWGVECPALPPLARVSLPEAPLAWSEPSVCWITEQDLTFPGEDNHEHPAGKCQLAYETVTA